MFEFLKKRGQLEIYSPIVGECFNLEKVQDKVFSTKLIGDGLAFRLNDDTIYSPCDGKIVFIFETKHAIGIKSKNGTEILIHVGIDTVNLNGKGFDVLVSENCKIKRGQPLMKIDRNFMNQNKVDLTIPMIVTNVNAFDLTLHQTHIVNLDNVVMITKNK